MRKSSIILSSLMVLTLALSPAFAQKSYKELSYPKINDTKIPDVERIVLENGIILFILEDHELPLIHASAQIGVGSYYEPADKAGLASITGDVMRTGGSVSMPGEKMDEILESMAATVETGIGKNSGSASMFTLKENLDQTLGIFADVLMHPAFPDNKIQLAKVQENSSISRRNDDPMDISRREFGKIIYGANHPNTRQTEYATIDAISRDDIIAFHKEYFRPENIILGVWGDFKKDEMVAKIKDAFKDWKKSDFKRPPLPTVDYDFSPSVNLVKKDDINQSYIYLGHIGGIRNNPDYPALQVMNTVLGGSMTSRVFRNIRSRMGLAYSAFGVYSCNFDIPGMFYLGCQTKSESTMKATKALIEEIRKMSTEPVTDEELTQAKDEFLNSYVFNFDSKGKIISRLMTYEYYGYPKDFLQKTKESIEKVTKEDIKRVAEKYLKADKVRVLVVGNPEKFDEPLKALGEVKEIDISIPEPKKN